MTILEGDLRVQKRELELAKLQADESAPRQLESNLIRDSLKQTLNTAAVFARAVSDVVGDVAGCFDASIEAVSSDLAGKDKS